MSTLIFIYNADTGLFNTMADIGHKIFSPSTYKCDLCALTHGYFSEQKSWRNYIEAMNIETRFLHRDEFLKEFPQLKQTQLPAVFLQDNEQTKLCVNAKSLADCKDLDDLQNLITLACEQALTQT